MGSTAIAVHVEHDRGPFNGLAEIDGTVTDPSGAVLAQASVEVRATATGKIRSIKTDAGGQFSLSGVADGKYQVQVSVPGFKTASGEFAVRARDRAVVSATLSIAQASQIVEVTATSPVVETEMAMVATRAGVGGAVPVAPRPMKELALDGRNVIDYR